MSRIAKNPIPLPNGVQVDINGCHINIKGKNGTLDFELKSNVNVSKDGSDLKVNVTEDTKTAWIMAGTTRALINNMVIGVSEGFEKKLQLVGVGYRVQSKGQELNLTLGFSHPVNYKLPEGVSAETPSQTEIIIKGIDKQKVGQIAAEIRAYRPPEPYKGKGVRYFNEQIVRKEAKKK